MTNILADWVSVPCVPSPHGAEHARFCAARRIMLDRLGEWLETHPPAADGEMEIEGTVTLVRALATLAWTAGR